MDFPVQVTKLPEIYTKKRCFQILSNFIGRTTFLEKLNCEIETIIPSIGDCIEKAKYKNFDFTVSMVK